MHRIARPLPGRSCRAALAVLLAACAAAPANAQPGTTGSLVPRSGFFAGIGGGYQSVKFGTQDLYAIGTSEVTQAGVVVATGVAAGAASVQMPNESTAAPTLQGGYFRHFDARGWLWGVKAGYTYVDRTATLENVVMPQAASFTIL